MPHIVVEHSQNLDTDIKDKALLPDLRQVLIDTELFSPEAIQGRSISYSNYALPEGKDNFIHITISILSGRPLEKRQELSVQVFELVKEKISQAEKLSVNIHEMNPDTYKK